MTDGDRLGIGLSLPTWPLRGGAHARWSELRQLARDIEAAGVDTLWVSDHLQRTVRGRPPFGFWECWTVLTAAAEATSRIGVGPFILNSGFRNPGLVARMATTLDEVSGGRLVLAMGSGDPAHDDSWRAFGFDAERHVGRHAEAVEVVARMLREPPVTFEGEHVRVDGADVLPRGPRARIPIWLAAKGDRTLAIAARWGDAVNVNVPLAGAADAEAIVARARSACEAEGRDPGTLAVTGWARLSLRDDGTAEARPGWLDGSPDEVASRLGVVREAGVSHVTLYAGEAGDPAPLPALTAPVLERLVPFLDAIRAA